MCLEHKSTTGLKHGTASPLSALLLYPGDILSAHSIPGPHVLLHTLREASLFAAREGSSGFWHTLLEAVLIEFLYSSASASKFPSMLHTSISCLAFCRAASCLTWFIRAAFGSEDEEPKPRELLTPSILGDEIDASFVC
jgi:hypothetical protein